MRLICPNCGAQYEVDDAVIPDQGRDVQCSNCGHTWFQQSAVQLAAEDSDDLQAEFEPETSDEQPEDQEPRGLDPEIADLLREEAEREAAERANEAEGLETQPDLGIEEADDAAASRSAAARSRMARLRGLDEGASGGDAAAADAGPRRNRLPDVDDIEPTLPTDASPVEEEFLEDAELDQEPRRRGGGRLIFRLILLVVFIGIVVYVLAPQIVQWVPQSEPWMIAYVDWANQLRAQINQGIDFFVTNIRDLITRFTG